MINGLFVEKRGKSVDMSIFLNLHLNLFVFCEKVFNQKTYLHYYPNT